MLCLGDKTKLLIIATTEQRSSKLEGHKIRIQVGDKMVEETEYEKLLGIMINNKMSWSTYLYGSNQQAGDNSTGLLTKLSKRVGMLVKLGNYMTTKRFDSLCDGLFTSTLLYCLPLFINVWDIPTLDDTARRSVAFSKEDCRKLQVLQNKVLRCKTRNFNRHTPTCDLLKETGDLSVHQLGAYHSLLTLARIFLKNKPEYFVNRLSLRKPASNNIFPSRHLNMIQVNCNLSLSRSGFSYRTSKLWNCLPGNLRSLTNMKMFKGEVKEWVKEFVTVKPRWRT